MKRDQGKGNTARSNAAVRICFLHNLVGQLRTRNMPRSSFNFSRPLCGLFLGETMSKGKWAFRPTDLKRAIKASSNTGLEIARAEIEPATGPKSGLPRTGAILTVTANQLSPKGALKCTAFSYAHAHVVTEPRHGSAPAKRARPSNASSIRSASFHFAMRSERENEPTLS
jgi:hypothetical protein